MNLLAAVARAPRWMDRWWTVSPEVGIYLGAGCLSTAVMAPATRQYRLASSRVEPLPEGVVVPSPVESNIRRPEIVIERLKAALPSPNHRESAISLPDAAARVAIVELAQLPARRMEREGLFRHHLERLFLTPLGRCRFAFQSLTPSGAGRQRVLVVAIREDILDEYESVVRAAGLRPSVVDLSAFHLFNLYERRICAALPQGRRILFLNLFDHNFTMIVADRDGPQLIRIKAFPDAIDETDLMTRVLVEIEASLRAFDSMETQEGTPIERMFVFSDHLLGELDQRVHEDYCVETTHLPSNGWPDAMMQKTIRESADRGVPNGSVVASPGASADEQPQAVTMALAAAVGCRTRSEASLKGTDKRTP
jgi:hypothetical protein